MEFIESDELSIADSEVSNEEYFFTFDETDTRQPPLLRNPSVKFENFWDSEPSQNINPTFIQSNDNNCNSNDAQRKENKPRSSEEPLFPQTNQSQIPLERISLDKGKAGLQQVDTHRVNKIIYELSKNSRFFKNEQRKDLRVKQQIKEMLDKLEEIKKAHTDDEQVMEIIDRKIASFEAERDLSQIWFHVDMDAFFASVEIRDNPQLRGKPIAVGDMSMITTSSYEARKWGVRSAMPGFIAKELCPELIFVPPNFAKYKEASKKTRQVFGEYDPQFESWSLDEAALSLTDYLTAHRHLTVEDVVKEIQRKIYDATQLTCSIGVAANKRLAKIVTDINKPNGYFILPSDAMVIKQFVSQLPCRKIPGIGKVTNQLLAALKIEKVGQLLEQRLILYKLFSERSFDFFMRAALGLGSTVHDENGPRKSIGRQRTFKGLDQKEKQLQLLRELCELVAKDLKKEQLSAKKVTVVYKTVDFELKTKCQTLPRYINTAEDIFFFAHKILSNEMPLKLRLLGVRMSAFKLTENSQNDLLATNQRQISKFLHGRQPTKEKNEIVPCEDKKDDDSHDSSVTEENDYQDTSSGNNDLDGLSPSEIYKRLNKKMKERISEMQETNTNSGSKRSLSVLEQTGPTKKRRVLKGQQTLEFFFQRKEGDSKSV